MTNRRVDQASQNRKRYRVFLPYGHLFTSVTSADFRLRSDEGDPKANGPNGVLYGTWRQLPVNPLCDLERPEAVITRARKQTASPPPKPATTLTIEADEVVVAAAVAGDDEGAPSSSSRKPVKMPQDYPFHCDACQKGFNDEDAYTTHLASHTYCEVPGCKFTCRKDRPWRMTEHVETLHNRPDAPNLVDTEQYLAQRRRRFPTSDNVAQKVEELYYKAARGAVLPEERRRWMRQHGIEIGRQGRNEGSYVVKGDLPVERSVPGEAESEAHRSPSRSSHSPRESQPQSRVEADPSATALVSVAVAETRGPRRVPRFYVCSRCHVKGEHWVSDCPATASAEAAGPPPSQADTAVPLSHYTVAAEDDSAPALQSARMEFPLEGMAAGKEATCVVAPVAAAKRAKQQHSKRQATVSVSTTRATAPSLYEKLTEEDRVSENGLLLQAIRFFVARDFFESSS